MEPFCILSQVPFSLLLFLTSREKKTGEKMETSVVRKNGNAQIICYSLLCTLRFEVSKVLILVMLLVSKEALNRSKVKVNTFRMLQTIDFLKILHWKLE